MGCRLLAGLAALALALALVPETAAAQAHHVPGGEVVYHQRHRGEDRGAAQHPAMQPLPYHENEVAPAGPLPSLGRILKSLRTASKKGDSLGAKIAVDQLKAYKQTNRVGLLGRFRIWWAERKILGRIKYAGRRQDIQRAAENVAILASLRGEKDGKTKKGIELLHKYAIKTAKHHARNGSPPGAQQALEMAKQASAAGGFAFDEAKAEKIMRFAYKRGAGAYVWNARQAYQKGELKEAAAMLVESLEIEQNPQIGFRPGFFARRQRERLLEKLAPHVEAVRAEKAAALQAQAEEMARMQEEAEQGGGAPQHAAPAQAPTPRRQPPQHPAHGPGAVEVVEPVGPSAMDPGPG